MIRAARGRVSRAGDITDALMHLRDKDLAPWDWIEDETRTLHDWEFAPSAFEYVRNQASYARIDLWGGNEAPLVICGGATAGVLRRIASEYLVPITATKGQCGGFLVNKVVPLLRRDRPVLYIDDFELRGPGEQIEDNTRRRLERHLNKEIKWERIALTKEQVDADPHLQSLVIDKIDRTIHPRPMRQSSARPLVRSSYRTFYATS